MSVDLVYTNMNVCISISLIFIDISIVSIIFVASSKGRGVYYVIEKE